MRRASELEEKSSVPWTAFRFDTCGKWGIAHQALTEQILLSSNDVFEAHCLFENSPVSNWGLFWEAEPRTSAQDFPLKSRIASLEAKDTVFILDLENFVFLQL